MRSLCHSLTFVYFVLTGKCIIFIRFSDEKEAHASEDVSTVPSKEAAQKALCNPGL